MALHPTRLGVGEPSKYEPPAPEVAPVMAAGSDAALEAAQRIAERREPLARFLLRKQRETDARAPQAQRHWKAYRRRAPDPPAEAAFEPGALERIDEQLLAVAAALTGHWTIDEASSAVGGAAAMREGAVASLGELVGTPRDMSVAAARELRAALREMQA